MLLFGLGKLLYVIILIINAIAILSEDRFLARIGWGRTQYEPGFGTVSDNASIKAKSVNLIASVRTVMRTSVMRKRTTDKSTSCSYRKSVPLIAINLIVIIYEIVLG
ncbi:hypothetical protein PAAG_07031 [Paracoccidioides lutzii Pb01]|uniref:Yos1-like protein n=1 Tax=Paracoccidioides lutzii (strain ATCC MYA-826 / Pb01) TaxID=502779 RepID=C1H854_PARBA|nr:hypothetical protein PAAG_07031 [Paracoccidioides lutzii Pb01]EEH36613.2 hypothetical protein PAAG_07031 [Paracoccidioides lutzii Pb01]